MDALTALQTRASAARLVEPAPTDEQINTIIAAAANAPDHGKLRPWRFLAIRGSAKAKLGEILAQALARRNAGAGAQALDAERKKAERAPLIIVVTANVQTHPKVPDIEQIVAVGAATQNILIASHALGFGAFWRTGPAAYDEWVKQQLSILDSEHIVGFIYLGTNAVTLPQRSPPQSLQLRFL